MLVVCNGMRGSGSTFLYNVTRKLLEDRLNGTALGFVSPSSLNVLYPHLKPTSKCAAKTHDFLPNDNTWLNHGLKLIYSHRDPRDAVLSLLRRANPDETMLVKQLEFEQKIYNFVSKDPRTLCLRYERFFADPKLAINQIAGLLRQRLTTAELDDIAAETSIDAALKTMPKTKGKVDSTSLLHAEHISGSKGQSVWRSHKNYGIIKYITKTHKDWIMQMGYPLS